MTTNDQRFKDLLSRLHAQVLKPLGYRKDGANFRLITPDGMGRIINFQKSAWNTAEELSFCINLGVYYEQTPAIGNPKFKEYDCLIRTRASGISTNPVHKGDHWWTVFENRDMDKLYEELKELLSGDTLAWFEKVPSREYAVGKYGFSRHWKL